MSRHEIIQEMLKEKLQGRIGYQSSTLSWTSGERPSFQAPSPYVTPAGERVFKQPFPNGNYTEPISSRRFKQFQARSSTVPNKRRVDTPHIYGRVNFIAPSVLPRSAGFGETDYAASVGDVASSAHANVLTTAVNIKFPDAGDLEWLAEKARLVSAGQHNVLPLGREQRTVVRKVKPADELAKQMASAHDASSKLAVLSKAMADGLTNTHHGIVSLGGQLATMLKQNQILRQMTQAELGKVYKAIRKLGIKTWRDEGFSQRFWSHAEYATQGMKGQLLLYMLKNASLAAGNPNLPIKQFVWKIGVDGFGTLEESKWVNINHLDQKMNVQKSASTGADNVPLVTVKYIDLELNAIVPLEYAIEQVREGKGVSDRLNGFRLPYKPIDDTDDDIVPVGILNPDWADDQKFDKKKQQDMGADLTGLATRKLVPVVFGAAPAVPVPVPVPPPSKKKKKKGKSKKGKK